MDPTWEEREMQRLARNPQVSPVEQDIIEEACKDWNRKEEASQQRDARVMLPWGVALCVFFIFSYSDLRTAARDLGVEATFHRWAVPHIAVAALGAIISGLSTLFFTRRFGFRVPAAKPNEIEPWPSAPGDDS